MKNTNKKVITKAVIFTVRYIESHDLFKGIRPQKSKALIDFFMKRDNCLTDWLIEQVSKPKPSHANESTNEFDVDKWKTEFNSLKGKVEQLESSLDLSIISEDKTLTGEIEKAQNIDELRTIKGNFDSFYNDDNKDNWKEIKDLIDKIPNAPDDMGALPYGEIDNKSDLIANHYDDLALKVIKADKTFCDKDNAMIQDRLGFYKVEEDDTVACAVYPWKGDTTQENHNINWANALIKTIKDEYEHVKQIYLVCHDLDFDGYSGKNEVVVRGTLLSEIEKEWVDVKVGVIVFQHNEGIIIGALKMKEVNKAYETIEKYANGFNDMIKVDRDGLNGKAHVAFCNDNISKGEEEISHED